MFLPPFSEEKPFAAVIKFQTLAQILETAIHGSERRTAHVFITPPDKSAALIQDKEHVCPFDSHSHKGKGATIIVGNVHQLYTFILFGCSKHAETRLKQGV